MKYFSMQDSGTSLSEADLSLVHALQISPRAPWSRLGHVLGIAPTTAARRWEHLTGSGAAWISCQPLSDGSPAVAVVEISCRPDAVAEVADVLGRDPEAMTVDLTSGSRDLLVTVSCSDELALASYLLDRLGAVAGIDSVHSHPLVGAYTDASRWRLRSLTPAQESAMQESLPQRTERITTGSALDRRLVALLSEDGRRSTADLAAHIEQSESTVRRRMQALLASGALRLRCEVARTLTEWRFVEWFFLRVPAEGIDQTGRLLASVPEVRAVLPAAGPHNVLVAAWLRSIADGQRLETQLRRRLPAVEVADRAIVLRPRKLVGRLLDHRGFATAVVPLRG